MARGGYTFSDIKAMDPTEVNYLWHYQNYVEKQRFNELASMLGVLWDLDDFKASSTKEASADEPASNKMFIPLSIVINPKIMEMIQKKSGTDSQIGGSDFKPPEENAKVIPMADLSKEDFLRMLGRKR